MNTDIGVIRVICGSTLPTPASSTQPPAQSSAIWLSDKSNALMKRIQPIGGDPVQRSDPTVLAPRTNLSEPMAMKPADLLRRLRRLATQRGWDLKIAEGGRHTKVTLNGRSTVVPRHPTDLPPGTLLAIMRQLGITPSDLEV